MDKILTLRLGRRPKGTGEDGEERTRVEWEWQSAGQKRRDDEESDVDTSDAT
ncbi:hypothetical protein LTR16_007019, partial [Cryomyces antarcticus]